MRCAPCSDPASGNKDVHVRDTGPQWGCVIAEEASSVLIDSTDDDPSPTSAVLQISGTFKVDGSGNVDFVEEDGIDYAAVTVQVQRFCHT